MSLLSKLESKLESAVEGIFARAFRGRIQPLEIARKIEKTMDEKKILSVGTAYAPNRFTVKLHPEDSSYLLPFAPTFLPELEQYVTEYAREIDCELTDAPSVELTAEGSVRPGSLEIVAEISDTPQVERKLKKKPQGTRFLLVVQSGDEEGKSYELGESETVVGRSSDCDLSLADLSASRRHARVVLDGDQFVVEDMESTNGTYVNDQKVDRCELRAGDLVSIGSTVLQFKVVHAV